jgi:hypothetical protein
MNASVRIDISNYIKGPINTIIASNPVNGKASLPTDNVIKYTPNRGYVGSDKALVVIETENDIIHVATAKINVGEPSSENITKITLEWEPSQDEALGYKVYYGPSSVNISKKLSELHTRTIDLNDPFLTLNLEKDLGMIINEMVCFQIVAFTQVGDSKPSEPLCKKNSLF